MQEMMLVLGDQQFPEEHFLPFKHMPFFMAEDVGLCTHYRYHKHKLIFFLASMRETAERFKKSQIKVYYESLKPVPFFVRLLEFVRAHQIKTIHSFEVSDKFFQQELMSFASTNHILFKFYPSPNFLCPRDTFKVYLKTHPKPFMKTFYEQERRRQRILINKDLSPVGGAWSFDNENRKKTPKVLTNKSLHAFKASPIVEEVKKLVSEYFPDHPGNVEDFWLPTTRDEALKWLEHFVTFHLDEFGPYQDAITNRDPFLYHSLMSPFLNAGLLTPQEVLERVLEIYQKNPKKNYSSIEGFIRQLIGWREFVFGIYQNFSDTQEMKNFFGHRRKLKTQWYQGTTGILPVDDAIKKAQQYGYCHHIERLMILSNFMLLSEIDPKEVHRWFMEMFVDSADWVMGPNVYGMGQFSDGGLFATKPYISGSNYILKMSDYKKGEWCEIWDALFWNFIGKHKDFFSKQYRLSFMVVTWDKMDPTRKKHLQKVAAEFIQSVTE